MVMQHHRQEWLHLGVGKLFQQIPKQTLWEGWAPQLMVCWLSTHVGFPPLENLANQADRDQYELLCRENTRMPVDAYKGCHLARVPSHAVVARSVDGKEDLIWELLNQAQVSPPPVFPSCIGVPAWIWGAFPHSLPATVEILVLGTMGTTPHVLHFTDEHLVWICDGQQ